MSCAVSSASSVVSVPLIVTPTIFAPEDFTPRKGVMTRYGKKMVRNDFYGTVTVLDLNII